MTAFVFGDEKSANPAPSRTRQAATKTNGVVGPTVASKARPRAIVPMPEEATIRGSTRSERRPANGESAAITIGWGVRRPPVVCAVRPRTDWKYRLRRKPTANVAA
jgi:hypothetical protein